MGRVAGGHNLFRPSELNNFAAAAAGCECEVVAAMAADACRATLLSGLAQFRAEYGPSACAVPFVDHVLAGLPAAAWDANTYAAGSASAAAAATCAPSPSQAPMPMPQAAAVAPPASTAVWEVELAGSYKPYEVAAQSALEKAFQCGEVSARIRLRGTEYDVALRGDDRRQRGVGADARSSRL